MRPTAVNCRDVTIYGIFEINIVDGNMKRLTSIVLGSVHVHVSFCRSICEFLGLLGVEEEIGDENSRNVSFSNEFHVNIWSHLCKNKRASAKTYRQINIMMRFSAAHCSWRDNMPHRIERRAQNVVHGYKE